VENIDCLCNAFETVKTRHPFRIDTVVILPDHLHCIWTLPPNDTDFSARWGLIKATFSRTIEKGERISQSRQKRGERGLWQRRFWEHQIRDEADFHRHIDYIHWNPVKHGWVRQVADWPHSSFHVYLERGIPSGTGFVTTSLTFLRCLSYATTFNCRKRFERGNMPRPAVG